MTSLTSNPKSTMSSHLSSALQPKESTSANYSGTAAHTHTVFSQSFLTNSSAAVGSAQQQPPAARDEQQRPRMATHNDVSAHSATVPSSVYSDISDDGGSDVSSVPVLEKHNNASLKGKPGQATVHTEFANSGLVPSSQAKANAVIKPESDALSSPGGRTLASSVKLTSQMPSASSSASSSNNRDVLAAVEYGHSGADAVTSRNSLSLNGKTAVVGSASRSIDAASERSGSASAKLHQQQQQRQQPPPAHTMSSESSRKAAQPPTLLMSQSHHALPNHSPNSLSKLPVGTLAPQQLAALQIPPSSNLLPPNREPPVPSRPMMASPRTPPPLALTTPSSQARFDERSSSSSVATPVINGPPRSGSSAPSRSVPSLSSNIDQMNRQVQNLGRPASDINRSKPSPSNDADRRSFASQGAERRMMSEADARDAKSPFMGEKDRLPQSFIDAYRTPPNRYRPGEPVNMGSLEKPGRVSSPDTRSMPPLMPSSRAASATVRHDVSPMASPRDRRSDSGASISSRFDPSNHDSAGRKPEQIRRGSGDRRTPDPARASAVKSPASSPSLGPSHFPPGLPVPPGAYPFPYLPYPMQPFMGYPYNIDRLLLEHQRDISRTHELRKSSAEAARKSPASEHSRSSSGDADRPRSRQSDQRSALSPMIRQNPHLTSMHGHPLALGFPPPPYNWGHGKC